jgi:hypothetical protein
MKGSRSAISSALFLAVTACLLPAFSDPGPSADVGKKISIALETRPIEPDPGIEPAPKPQLIAVAYEVDVYGGMAVGTLVQVFANDSETAYEGSYQVISGEAVKFQAIELETKGYVHSLNAESEEDSATTEHRRVDRIERDLRAGKTDVLAEIGTLTRADRDELLDRLRKTPSRNSDTAPAVWHLTSDPFPIEAEEPWTLRAKFRTSLPLEGRLFRLTLPAVHATEGTPVGPSPETELPMQVQITIHHPQPLPLAASDTHQILVDFVGDRTIVETARRTVRADRPFVLEFAVGSEEQPTLAGYFREREGDRQAVEALVTPPERPTEQAAARPKQVLFIVDTSGSMAKEEKLDQARRAVTSSIKKLSPGDLFNIVEFDAEFRMMSASPVELEKFGSDRVKEWLDNLQATGGTRLAPALAATLEQPEDPERHRMIMVVTDGVLADEREALLLLREKLGESRLFVVGTGQWVRQETLLRLAEYGRGAAAFAGHASELEAAVDEMFDRFSQPLGWDLKFEFAGAEVDEVLPTRLPDLYAGRPVRVVAWVRGELPSTLRVRMSTTEGEQLYDVSMPPLDTRC